MTVRLLTLALIIGLAAPLAGQQAPDVPPRPAMPPSAAERGQGLFLRDGCWECHGFAGQGGVAGATLAGLKLPASVVLAYVRQPAGAMPAFTEKVLSDQELTDIVAFLDALPAPEPVSAIPLLNDLRSR